MAVIIRGSQVVAAGCQLPLAESGELDRSLGSRHRAALGLSQESDAVVVIVSEETGTISLAIGGKLQREFSPETLRSRLYRLLTGETKDDSADSDEELSPPVASAAIKVTEDPKP